MRFEQRGLSCALTKWRKHLFDIQNAKRNMAFFKAGVRFAKAGLIAKCFAIWNRFASESREATLILYNVRKTYIF